MAKFALWTIFLLVCVTAKVIYGVTVINEAYQGITVALDPNLSTNRCEDIVNSLKVRFEEASRVLKESLGLQFGQILVIVPEKWQDCGSHSISIINGQLTLDHADFRVGSAHPVFGNQPWTDQFKSCGLPGNFIYLPESFVTANASSGNIILHEWAKYRWGAFEEYGLSGDPIFPSHLPFRDEDNYPNLCTNRKVTGFDECQTGESCRFHIDHNKLVTSSIMAVPEIPGAKFVCNEKNHKEKLPNKHNLLCDGMSIWQVIRTHPDFTDMRYLKNGGNRGFLGSTHDGEDSVELKVVQENRGNALVIAMENTASTNDATNRLTFIKESISQFIKYEVIDSYKVGFVEFSDIPENIVQLTNLDGRGRNLLMTEVMKAKMSKKQDNDLLRAIEVSTEVLGEGPGIIMMITSCPGRIGKYQLDQMVSSAKGNKIWVILYPYTDCSQNDVLSKLASRTNGQIIYVKDEILPAQHPYVSPTVRMRLSQSYRYLLQSESNYHIQQLQKEKCEEDEVWCSRDIHIVEDFNDLHYLYFYHDHKEHVFASSEVTVKGDGSCNLIEMSSLAKGTKTFECNLNKGATVSISVERDRPSDVLIFELVGTPERPQSNYDINIWSSSPLQNLTYSDPEIPAIHVELAYEKRRIINANVTLRIQAENVASDYYSYVNLNDQGIGADITGNDGIYSGYLLPIPSDKTLVLSVFANDNDRNAMIWPEEFDTRNERNVICCGSKLSTDRNYDHKESFTTSLTNIPVTVHISSSYLPIAPGQIKDLIAVQDGNEIKLSFTSPGQDLDHGTSSLYMLTTYENNLERQSLTEKLDVTPKECGNVEVVTVDIKNCSIIYGFTIAASDKGHNQGKDSNLAIIRPACQGRKNKAKMSGGQIAGIVIGVLLAIFLLVLLYFWIRRRQMRKNQGNQSGRKESNGHVESKPSTTTEMVPLSRPIRSIEDLTAPYTDERSTFVEMPVEDSPTKYKSMDNLEVNELVKQSKIKRKQSHDQDFIMEGKLEKNRVSTSSSPNIIGIPLLLNEAIEYKKKKEKSATNPDILNMHHIQYPPAASSSSSDGTEI